MFCFANEKPLQLCNMCLIYLYLSLKENLQNTLWRLYSQVQFRVDSQGVMAITLVPDRACLMSPTSELHLVAHTAHGHVCAFLYCCLGGGFSLPLSMS